MVVISSNKDTTGQAVGSSGTPSNLTGTYNVVIGKSSAPHTIKLYEDFQCPICKEFEQATGQQIQAAIADGKVKVDYHMVAFLDRSSTTQLLQPRAQRRDGRAQHRRPRRVLEVPHASPTPTSPPRAAPGCRTRP